MEYFIDVRLSFSQIALRWAMGACYKAFTGCIAVLGGTVFSRYPCWNIRLKYIFIIFDGVLYVKCNPDVTSVHL